MFSLVDRIVGVVNSLDCWESLVKVALAEVAASRAMAIDLLHGGCTVEAHMVWSEANNWAVLFVETVEIEETVTTVGVISGVERSEFCERWTGDIGEGMEVDAVECNNGNIG